MKYYYYIEQNKKYDIQKKIVYKLYVIDYNILFFTKYLKNKLIMNFANVSFEIDGINLLLFFW